MAQVSKFKDSGTARPRFDYSIREVQTLLGLYDQQRDVHGPAMHEELEALKSAALVLTVTAWETYVEDTVLDQFEHLIQQADTPDALASAFNAVAHSWLSSGPKPPDLRSWTGDGWRDVLLEHFTQELARFHSPNSKNVAALFSRYLSLDIRRAWHWSGVL